MQLCIFAIYDSGVSSWRLPMFGRARGEILRWWTEAVNNAQSDFSKHPGDFTLFHIGNWDDEKCSFDLFKAPVSLGVAVEYIKKEANAPISVKEVPS